MVRLFLSYMSIAYITSHTNMNSYEHLEQQLREAAAAEVAGQSLLPDENGKLNKKRKGADESEKMQDRYQF